MKKTLLIIGILAILIGGYFWTTYNSLVSANETVDNQWAQVESQYQRRYDLIPDLVESVKGAMKQEQAVFNAIAEARTRYAGAGTVNEKAAATSELEGALARLLVVMENYPQLKSIETVQTFMAQLEGTENRISVERKRYNDTVTTFNVKIKRFPTNVVGGMLGYTPKVYFEATEGAEESPEVKF